MLNIAVKAARRAGSLINRAALEGGLEIRAKNRNDFVTQVDQAAEQAIIDVIRRAYPEHGFLAEESGTSTGARPEFQWVIDPLDGTTNYIHGFPQYCVSIALEHKGVLTQAVVYDPAKNELFTASRGRGAYLDDRRMRASKCAQLADALVGTGFPFKELDRIDLYMRQLRTLMGTCAGVRNWRM
jgi:myo-inositol-1(or 4)-monophosphatase